MRIMHILPAYYSFFKNANLKLQTDGNLKVDNETWMNASHYFDWGCEAFIMHAFYRAFFELNTQKTAF